MKKFLSLLVFSVFLTTAVSAQFTRAKELTIVSADTLANTDTTTKLIPALTNGFNGIIIKPTVTKLSGTAAGKIYLYESLDGVDYGSAVDSLVLTNQTTNHTMWKRTAPLPVYYKIIGYSSGSVSEVLKVSYILRRYY